jgi:mono/diheme cytochrome c family protein
MKDHVPASRAKRYALISMAALFAVAIIGLLWMSVLMPRPMDFAGGPQVPLSAYHAEDPTGVPAHLRGASLIERGKYLTRAADCEACHTAEGGEPFAGGRAFVLPFGTLYSTNITPDKETGIGHYSDANFLKALQKGIGRDHKSLYPAMPFASYTYMTDADAIAIKAYLFTLAPVHAPARQNALSFPFNQRTLMRIWALLFNPEQRFEPRPERDRQWNRGAYLVEAMAHCGECHTPRTLLQSLNQRAKFSGAVQGGWHAYNITSEPQSGIGAWSDTDLEHYFATGHADGRGTASGPMGEVIDNSLQYMTPEDLKAMVVYLRSVSPVATSEGPRLKQSVASLSSAEDIHSGGEAVYAGACVGCHGWTGVSPVNPYATLIGVRSVNDPNAANVVQIILSGAHRHTSDEGASMPAFGSAYSDTEIAELANFVTAQFGTQASLVRPQNVATLRAQQSVR